MPINFPSNPTTNQTFTSGSKSWSWNGTSWVSTTGAQAIGYTGSQGAQGSIGYTGSQGSQGSIGYTGSQGTQGSIGYTGSQGTLGYTGSAGGNNIIVQDEGSTLTSALTSMNFTGSGVTVTNSGSAVTVAVTGGGGGASTVMVDKGTVTSGTVTFTVSDSAYQRLQVGGALTVATAGWPTTGTYGEVLIELVNGGAFAITWPVAINWIRADGTTSTSFTANGVTLQTAGTDFVLLWSRNAGTTIYGKIVR